MGFRQLGLWIVGFIVVFLILRFASSFSPITSSIFGVFEGLGGLLIKGVKIAIPKAASVASLVDSSYKETLNKVVSSVDSLKQQQSASGKEVTLNQTLDTFFSKVQIL